MAFFDELGKVISDKSKEAANRVKDITGVLQLKSKLSAEKDKINKAYITLGKAYYDRHEGELEGKFADEFHTIQAGLVKIASLEDEIAELEGTRVEQNAAFCSRCGAPMDSTTSADVHEPEEPEEMQETIFEEKDETAAGKAVDNAETEGTAGPDADSADASDSVSENTTDTAAQNENNSGEQA